MIDEVTCPDCQGTGIWLKKYACLTCEGTGKLTAEQYREKYCLACGKELSFIKSNKGVCDNEDCTALVEDEGAYWRNRR